MTREMGNEFEFPKTWGCQFVWLTGHTMNPTYCHGNDKIGGSLVELAYPRHEKGSKVGYEGLHNKDDGNDGKLSQLLGRQLGGEFSKNWAGVRSSWCAALVRLHSLRQGVNSWVLRLARNF